MWDRILNVVISTLLLCALTLVCVEVVLRYFLPRYLTDWGLEFTIYATVWAMFLAGGSLVRDSRHIRADIVLHMLPPVGQRVLEIVSLIAGIIFAAVLTGFGARMVWLAYSLGEKSESSAKFPLFLYYLALPVGTAMMLVELLRRLAIYVLHYDAERMRVTEEHVIRDK